MRNGYICPLTVIVFLLQIADSGSGDLCGYNGWRLYDQRYLRRTKEACHNRYMQSAVKLRIVHHTLWPCSKKKSDFFKSELQKKKKSDFMSDFYE
jgi:hypothetical protein